jgi:hypothetical protein
MSLFHPTAAIATIAKSHRKQLRSMHVRDPQFVSVSNVEGESDLFRNRISNRSRYLAKTRESLPNGRLVIERL